MSHTKPTSANEEINAMAERAYTRGFHDALKLARSKVGEVLTNAEIGDYDQRKMFSRLVEDRFDAWSSPLIESCAAAPEPPSVADESLDDADYGIEWVKE